MDKDFMGYKYNGVTYPRVYSADVSWRKVY
jgi:hypothetical protein